MVSDRKKKKKDLFFCISQPFLRPQSEKKVRLANHYLLIVYEFQFRGMSKATYYMELM